MSTLCWIVKFQWFALGFLYFNLPWTDVDKSKGMNMQKQWWAIGDTLPKHISRIHLIFQKVPILNLWKYFFFKPVLFLVKEMPIFNWLFICYGRIINRIHIISIIRCSALGTEVVGGDPICLSELPGKMGFTEKDDRNRNKKVGMNKKGQNIKRGKIWQKKEVQLAI